MAEGIGAALRIVAIIGGLILTWYIKRFITAMYQKYVDWKNVRDTERAKEDAQKRKDQFNGDVKGPPRP